VENCVSVLHVLFHRRGLLRVVNEFTVNCLCIFGGKSETFLFVRQHLKDFIENDLMLTLCYVFVGLLQIITLHGCYINKE